MTATATSHHRVPDELSIDQARQLAITAQFGAGDAPDSGSVLRHLGLLQLDPLRRVERAHRLTCLARMPADATVDSIDAGLWSPGPATAFETWVHAACLIPVEDWPLLRLARERAKGRANQPSEAAYADVLAIVANSTHGVTIRELEHAGNRSAGWSWSERKRAAEFLLWRGQLICSERRDNRRIYDLPERRLPPTILNTDLPREVILEHLAYRALSALGVATTGDVATYYNLTPTDAAEGLHRCGATQVGVRSWTEPAWTAPHVPSPSPTPGRARLIGPFDNLIFDRDRTRRVHDFDYTFEAYKPAHKRTYGHYVMGILSPAGRFLDEWTSDATTAASNQPQPTPSPEPPPTQSKQLSTKPSTPWPTRCGRSSNCRASRGAEQRRPTGPLPLVWTRPVIPTSGRGRRRPDTVVGSQCLEHRSAPIVSYHPKT
jgi:uncharacterized protein YcaQ